MKKMILTALIAATALSPVMASAQDGRGQRGDPDRGSAERQAARAERQAERAAQPAQQQRQDNPNREAFRAQRQAERAAQPQQNFDREAYRAQRQAQGGQQPGQTIDRSAWRAQRDARQGEQARVQGQAQQRQFDGNRSGFRQDRRDANSGFGAQQQQQRDGRQDYRQDRRGDRQDYRRDQNRGGTWNGNQNRGSDWGGNSNWNRGNSGNWNRQWRNDRQYNWQGWRGQNRNAFRLPRYYAPRGYNYGYQRFGIGVTLGSILFSQNYWINDPWDYRLPPAYGPYRWVRYYNDALLVDIETGEVVDVINDIFW